MNWNVLAEALAEEFGQHKARARVPDVSWSEGVCLENLLARLAPQIAENDDELDELEGWGLEVEGCPLVAGDLLTLSWSGFGPGTSGGHSIRTLTYGQRLFISVWQDDCPEQLVATVSPPDSPAGISEVVGKILNGTCWNSERGGPLLGGGVTNFDEITNYMPDLVSREVVEKAAFEHLNDVWDYGWDCGWEYPNASRDMSREERRAYVRSHLSEAYQEVPPS